MVALWARTSSGYFENRDIEFHISQNHHKAFQNKTGSVVGTSLVGDSGPCGRIVGCIPLVGWYKVQNIHLVGRD